MTFPIYFESVVDIKSQTGPSWWWFLPERGCKFSSRKSRDWSGRAPATVVKDLTLEIVAHDFSEKHVAEQQLLLIVCEYCVRVYDALSTVCHSVGLGLSAYSATRTCAHSSVFSSVQGL
jgi:hypothetical protein